ncbi:MAG: hypothetical protein WC381_00965 [Kiritimatiellia bacterium]
MSKKYRGPALKLQAGWIAFFLHSGLSRVKLQIHYPALGEAV